MSGQTSQIFSIDQLIRSRQRMKNTLNDSRFAGEFSEKRLCMKSPERSGDFVAGEMRAKRIFPACLLVSGNSIRPSARALNVERIVSISTLALVPHSSWFSYAMIFAMVVSSRCGRGTSILSIPSFLRAMWR